MSKQYDVIIIGGGVTGAGTARDCSMRGLSVLLIEKSDYANGASGRNHGLMHSGARYAVTDGESARECIKENMILRNIAKHCVEETDGLFITLPEDDLGYQQTFVEACTAAGIRADVLEPKEALRIEPAVNPSLIGAVRVPDASIDPFRLTAANVADAVAHGAEVQTYSEVTSLIIRQTCVEGVVVRDNHTGQVHEEYGRIVINAAGIWGHVLTRNAGVTVNMFPSKGSLLVYGHRVSRMVINRCRKPANADILVPDDAVCVIGTTSDRVPFDVVDDLRVTTEEVNVLMTEGEKLAPELAHTRILRAYAGVRPLVASDNDPSGRSISRGIICIDHETRDGLAGFITITGGKMMTYRLMAELATDLACHKLGVERTCETAVLPLPGSESEAKYSAKEAFATNAANGRHGAKVSKIGSENTSDRALVCECEGVSVGEIRFALGSQHVNNLIDLRRRIRAGMGTCQACLCAARTAGVVCGIRKNPVPERRNLAELIEERWKGIRPVAWGDAICEAQLTSIIYDGLLGVNL